uniref:Uncharacterized protein n=1 Tax=viral metagenome TaxID=1070528 RepID=A0A6C0H308_9ZZZZ
MSEEKIVQKEEVDDTKSESENNQMGYNEEEYLTGDDNKETSDDENESSDVDKEEENEDTTIFILSVDGIPLFYTKTIVEAREKMWEYAKLRRIQETQYNTYIRGCPDKNRIEVVGCHKFSVFFVDRTICWLLVSPVQGVNVKNRIAETKTPTTNPPTTPTTPPSVDPPPSRSFFSSFFW